MIKFIICKPYPFDHFNDISIKKFTFFIWFFVLQIDRNNTQLSSNATSVLNEIEEMHTRLTNVLKERTEFLKSSVDKYLIVESKTLKDLKENLELELANIKVSQWKRAVGTGGRSPHPHPHPSESPTLV